MRSYLPLVQVSPAGTWRSGGRVAYALAEEWLGRPLTEAENLGDLVFRYLAAFGPGTVKDVQTWSGLVRPKEGIGKLKPELRTFRDEQGNELLDLPGMPLPPSDTPAPARFLPEEHRKKVFLSAGRVRGTFLLDGTVRGIWKIERSRGSATLVIEPFDPLLEEHRNELAEEGEQLLRFVEDDLEKLEVWLGEEA